MMAHYFHHLTMVNRHIFVALAYGHARLTKSQKDYYWRDYWFYGEEEQRKLFASVLQFIYPIATWTCVRYHYHMPFNLLLHNTVMVIEPINFLCSFIRPGGGWGLFILL